MQMFKIVVIAFLIFNMVGCVTDANLIFQKPSMDKGRTLILGEEEFNTGEPWEFVTWKCRDFSTGVKTLVEVGRVTLPIGYKDSKEYQFLTKDQKLELNELAQVLGFVLYDGTNAGDIATYRRDGLTHRWDWGDDGNSYSIIIKTDGTGLYYDFRTAKDGKKTKADDIFKCKR